MKTELDRDDAAWEAELAAAWKAAAEEEDAAGGAEESAALARRLDGTLRAERAARRAGRVRAWLSLGAAAACAALVALAAWRSGFWGGGAGTETAAGEAEEESDVAEAREAPVSEAFGELENVLTELAALDFSYAWDDEDLEMAD